MPAELINRPPHLSRWDELDDDCPRPPEVSPPPWPLAVDVLDSAQSRRASRNLHHHEPAPRTA